MTSSVETSEEWNVEARQGPLKLANVPQKIAKKPIPAPRNEGIGGGGEGVGVSVAPSATPVAAVSASFFASETENAATKEKVLVAHFHRCAATKDLMSSIINLAVVVRIGESGLFFVATMIAATERATGRHATTKIHHSPAHD